MHHISRRKMLKELGIGTATVLAQGFASAEKSMANPKKHIITLSFDDGIKKSSIKTAEIFEKHKLQACINVIATGHLSDFKIPDPGHVDKKGDFVLWNELKMRGHEVMPHTYSHVNFTEIPFEKAKEEINLCLEYFSKNLKGFDAATSIYNFAYNASTPETEAYLMDKVKAFRTEGKEINEMPHKGQQKLTCGAFGPGNSEKYLEEQITKLLRFPSGWLIINQHGLDEEGWGPIGSDFLDRLLGRLEEIETVAILPTGVALDTIK